MNGVSRIVTRDKPLHVTRAEERQKDRMERYRRTMLCLA